MVQVHKMLSCWEKQIVVTTSIMPVELAKKLLEAGAKAVICRGADTDIKEKDEDIVSFFSAFYSVLLSGRPVVKAISHAGRQPVNIAFYTYDNGVAASLTSQDTIRSYDK